MASGRHALKASVTPLAWAMGAMAVAVVAGLVVLSVRGILPPLAWGGAPSGTSTAISTPRPSGGASATADPSTAPSAVPTPAVPTTLSANAKMLRVDRVTGGLSPKSVVASQHGLVFAQNMIYRHTVSVFDERSHELVSTISDRVRLSRFGFDQYPSPVRGGPVEAAATPDGAFLYVSNYSMYGPGFSHPGDDKGGPRSGVDPSFVYRISTTTLKIDRAIEVGSVPKYVAVTPDGRYVLVSNWISYTLSVIDTVSGTEVRQVPIGPYPRGIAVSPDSRTAYVAVMGSTQIAVVDLEDFSVDRIRKVGLSPRHLVISPDGGTLYATLNGRGKAVKISLEKRKVIDSVATGRQPRSMTISPDGSALYVVNYESATVSKVRTSDMTKVQDVAVDTHPIGIAYVNATKEIWVACYGGSIVVFADRDRAY